MIRNVIRILNTALHAILPARMAARAQTMDQGYSFVTVRRVLKERVVKHLLFPNVVLVQRIIRVLQKTSLMKNSIISIVTPACSSSATHSADASKCLARLVRFGIRKL